MECIHQGRGDGWSGTRVTRRAGTVDNNLTSLRNAGEEYSARSDAEIYYEQSMVSLDMK